MAVMVLHDRRIEAAGPWPQLRRCLEGGAGTGFMLRKVLIYDNSSLPQPANLAERLGCTYLHDGSNGGTAAAYQRACALARESCIDWLLLLDQDSELPPDFLAVASATLVTLAGVQPCALVPWVFHHGKVISPARITPLGSIRPLAYDGERADGEASVMAASAIASGSLVYVPALAEVVPIPSVLWLDFVDHWIFRRMRLSGRPIAVMQTAIQHDLSVESPGRLGGGRLRSILDSEAYFTSQLGLCARMVYPLRILGRLARYLVSSPRNARCLAQWIGSRVGHD